MSYKSRVAIVSAFLLGTVIIGFQNCAKEAESPTTSKVTGNGVSPTPCSNPFGCTSPSPTPTPTIPGGGGVSPTPTPTTAAVSNKQAAIVSSGIAMKSNGAAIPDYGFYGLTDTITAIVAATDATGVKWGNDDLTCTGSVNITCKKDYGPFGVNNGPGFYGDLDVVAANGSNPALKSSTKIAGSQCFSMLAVCQYFSIANEVERGRPRALGIFSASNRTPQNCGTAFDQKTEFNGAKQNWDRSINECFVMRVAINEANASDYECFYPAKSTLAEAMAEPISEANRYPCNAGKTYTELQGDPTKWDGTIEGFGAVVVRKKSTGQSDRVVVKTTCVDKACVTAVDQTSHRRQNCTSPTQGGACTNEP